MQQDPQICHTGEDWPETSKKSKFMKTKLIMIPVHNNMLILY